MRSRILPAVGVSAIAVLAASAFAGSANASNAGAVHTSHLGTAAHAVHHMKKGACYSNTADDSGDGVLSQNFSDSGFEIYDSAGAADFKVKKSCKIKTITTAGVYFNGAGPADSVNVLIYKNKKKLPGKVVNEQDNRKYTDSTGLGSLVVKGKKVTLKKGSYWISVVANMAFASGGEWGWETSTDQPGQPDVWQNPGGGFGVCPTWGPVVTCISGAPASDYMVSF